MPYGAAHACEIVYPNTSKRTLGAIYATVAALVMADSLVIARHDSTDTNVAILIDPQPPHGICARPSRGPNWTAPTIGMRFAATLRGEHEADYRIAVRGTAISAEGSTGGGTVLALCYLARYAFPLDSLPPHGAKQ